MAGFVFDHGANKLLDGSIVWGTGTYKARLSRTTETPVAQDATAMTGLGLSATDVALGTLVGPTVDHATHRNKYGAADAEFLAVAAGAEVDKIIIFKFTTDDAGSEPIAVVAITPITPNGGDISVLFASGICFYLQG